MRRFKVVILGSSRAGKTSIIQKYINGQFVVHTTSSTQAAFFQKDLSADGLDVTLEIWDTAGQEKFKSLAPIYYRDAKGAFVVFDLTDASSFAKAKQWVNELRSARGDDISVVLIGNKYDLQSIRVVAHEEILQYCKATDLDYFETSAKTGYNVDQIFLSLAGKVGCQPPSSSGEAARLLRQPLGSSSAAERSACC